MNPLILLATVGAGVGLAAGLAFNLRLARSLGVPLAASLVNFLVGALVLLTLWTVGLDRSGPTVLPPGWMLLGGVMGSSYVTLSLIGAARLGAGLSTVAVTLGQVLGALLISGGWFGQSSQIPNIQSVASAFLLVVAVAVLAKDRERR